MNRNYLIHQLQFFPQTRALVNSTSGQNITLTNLSAICLQYLCERSDIWIHETALRSLFPVASSEAIWDGLLELRRAFITLDAPSILIMNSQSPRRVLLRRGEKASVGTDSRLAPGRGNEEDKTMTPYAECRKRLRLPRVAALALFSALMLLLAGSGQIFTLEKNAASTGYVPGSNITGKCAWQYNADAGSYKRHASFTATHKELCRDRVTIYVTAYPASTKVSAIICNKALLSYGSAPHCLSLYFPNQKAGEEIS